MGHTLWGALASGHLETLRATYEAVAYDFKELASDSHRREPDDEEARVAPPGECSLVGHVAGSFSDEQSARRMQLQRTRAGEGDTARLRMSLLHGGNQR